MHPQSWLAVQKEICWKGSLLKPSNCSMKGWKIARRHVDPAFSSSFHCLLSPLLSLYLVDFQLGFFLFLMPSSLFLSSIRLLSGWAVGHFSSSFFLFPILSLSSIWFPIGLLPLPLPLPLFSSLYKKASFRMGSRAFFFFCFFSSFSVWFPTGLLSLLNALFLFFSLYNKASFLLMHNQGIYISEIFLLPSLSPRRLPFNSSLHL